MALEHIDLWAILGGLAIAYGIVFLLSLMLGLGEAMSEARRTNRAIRRREEELGRHLTEDELEQLFDSEWDDERITREWRQDTRFMAGLTVVALLADVLAGYYTALWADAAPLMNAAIMGAVQLPLGFLLDCKDTVPRWAFWVSTVLIMPAVLAGAVICCGLPG